MRHHLRQGARGPRSAGADALRSGRSPGSTRFGRSRGSAAHVREQGGTVEKQEGGGGQGPASMGPGAEPRRRRRSRARRRQESRKFFFSFLRHFSFLIGSHGDDKWDPVKICKLVLTSGAPNATSAVGWVPNIRFSVNSCLTTDVCLLQTNIAVLCDPTLLSRFFAI